MVDPTLNTKRDTKMSTIFSFAFLLFPFFHQVFLEEDFLLAIILAMAGFFPKLDLNFWALIPSFLRFFSLSLPLRVFPVRYVGHSISTLLYVFRTENSRILFFFVALEILLLCDGCANMGLFWTNLKIRRSLLGISLQKIHPPFSSLAANLF